MGLSREWQDLLEKCRRSPEDVSEIPRVWAFSERMLRDPLPFLSKKQREFSFSLLRRSDLTQLSTVGKACIWILVQEFDSSVWPSIPWEILRGIPSRYHPHLYIRESYTTRFPRATGGRQVSTGWVAGKDPSNRIKVRSSSGGFRTVQWRLGVIVEYMRSLGYHGSGNLSFTCSMILPMLMQEDLEEERRLIVTRPKLTEDKFTLVSEWLG